MWDRLTLAWSRRGAPVLYERKATMLVSLWTWLFGWLGPDAGTDFPPSGPPPR